MRTGGQLSVALRVATRHGNLNSVRDGPQEHVAIGTHPVKCELIGRQRQEQAKMDARSYCAQRGPGVHAALAADQELLGAGIDNLTRGELNSPTSQLDVTKDVRSVAGPGNYSWHNFYRRMPRSR